VWLLAEPPAEAVKTSVDAEGPWIPPEWRERIFKPFRQVEGF
jgi:signal transduction histidine kinase